MEALGALCSLTAIQAIRIYQWPSRLLVRGKDGDVGAENVMAPAQAPWITLVDVVLDIGR